MAVSGSGLLAVVGANTSNSPSPNTQGAAYVYRRVAATKQWTLLTQLNVTTTHGAATYVGDAVAISDTGARVAATASYDPAQLFVFDLKGASTRADGRAAAVERD